MKILIRLFHYSISQRVFIEHLLHGKYYSRHWVCGHGPCSHEDKLNFKNEIFFYIRIHKFWELFHCIYKPFNLQIKKQSYYEIKPNVASHNIC